jgi:hypothetical protein
MFRVQLVERWVFFRLPQLAIVPLTLESSPPHLSTTSDLERPCVRDEVSLCYQDPKPNEAAVETETGQAA